jgi:hypothetical protein
MFGRMMPGPRRAVPPKGDARVISARRVESVGSARAGGCARRRVGISGEAPAAGMNIYGKWARGESGYKDPTTAIEALERKMKLSPTKFLTNDECVADSKSRFDNNAGIKGAGEIAHNRNLKLDENDKHDWGAEQKRRAKEAEKEAAKQRSR